MNSSVIFVIIQLAAVTVLADIPAHSNVFKNLIENGKYFRSRNNDGTGSYIPMGDRKYIHVHDMREKGRYIYIPYPYDGGYGPYFGQNIPYDYDPAGEYSSDKFHTVSNPYDPFYTNEYTIPRPEIYLQYGFPQFSPNNVEDNTDRSASASEENANTESACDCPQRDSVPPIHSYIENSESITNIAINQDISQTVTDTESASPNTPIPEILNDIHKRIRKSISSC